MISPASSSLASAYFRPGPSCADGSCEEPNKAAQSKEETERAAQQPQPAAPDDRSPPAGASQNASDTHPSHSQGHDKKTGQSQEKSPSGEELSEEDLQQIQQLKQRDQEVRTHEAAHLAAAGQYARGGASYSYQTGPDGKRYATGGEVSIDTSPIPGDPEATLQKANTLRAAATAPAEPSSQDRQVAAEAAQMAAEARQQISEEQIQTSAEQASGQPSSAAEKEEEESKPSDSQPAREYQAIASLDAAPQASLRIDYTA